LLILILFGLQIFPPTGFFLIFLGAPFWSVILINLGFALMGLNAWRDARKSWLMLFPALWFGGYLAATMISHWQADRYVTEIAATNAGRRIAFDQARQDVVIARDRHDETNGSELRALTLVNAFGLDRAYQVSSDGLGGYRSVSLLTATCPSRFARTDDGTTTDYGRPIDRQGQRVRSTQGLCIVHGSQAPQRPIVRIRPQPQVLAYGGGSISQDILIDTPDGATVTLRSGWARALTWLPLPMIGCDLKGCGAEFLRESLYDARSDRTPQTAEKVVAQALGLRKITIYQRHPNAGWR
jgi:hypothetical protein